MRNAKNQFWEYFWHDAGIGILLVLLQVSVGVILGLCFLALWLLL